MNIDTIKKIYNEKKEVHFKLFSLEYTILEKENKVIIYEDLYKNKYKTYNNLEELLNYFTVYNETIITNQNRLQNIK